MTLLRFLGIDVLETLLRVFPFPCKTGLKKVGNPDRNGPVFLTGNYRLTVERVKRALAGLDAYLLVANSRGINVWCAAAGGLLTNHDVISVLKTSGIEDLVDHRKVVLPQFAATGVEARAVKEKTGWKIMWGPVYAKDIPAFLENGLEKMREMREVRFRWPQRAEMAVAWAFPISVVSALIVVLFWREALLPLSLLVWGLSFLIFLCFPLYSRWLSSGGKRVGIVFFDFGQGGFQLILWGIFLLGIIGYSLGVGRLTLGFVIPWCLVSLVIIVLLSIDLMGSTPVYKSCLHEDRLLRVVLDNNRCKVAGVCAEVCPRDCYEVDRARRSVAMPGADRCVQCGACIVQCPFDALYFEGPEGQIITPEAIRRYKLNLLGKRIVKTQGK